MRLKPVVMKRLSSCYDLVRVSGLYALIPGRNLGYKKGSEKMKRLKKLLCLMISFLLLAPCFTINAVAADDGTLTVITPSTALKAGDEFDVTVRLEANPGIVIFRLYLMYDNTRFDYVSVTRGPVLGIQALDVKDDVYDGVSAVSVTNGLRTTPFTGNGVLYTVKFKVKPDAPPGKAVFALAYRVGDIVGEPIWTGNGYISNNFFPATIDGQVQAGDGVTLTGTVRSYNPKNETTLRLMQGTTEVYRTTIEAASSGMGQVEQRFDIVGVAPGTYSLVINKTVHTSFTLQNITVGSQNIDLRLDTRPDVRVMTLRCGDINGDGMINDADLAELWKAANYNKSAVAQGVNERCDLNGDGMVNDADLAILWLAANYNKGAALVSYT